MLLDCHTVLVTLLSKQILRGVPSHIMTIHHKIEHRETQEEILGSLRPIFLFVLKAELFSPSLFVQQFTFAIVIRIY
jgi:hypothetical protein